MITPEHIKAARAVLGWGRRDLAEAASLSYDGICRIEKKENLSSVRVGTLMALTEAFREAGVTFLEGRQGRMGITWGSPAGERLPEVSVESRLDDLRELP